MYLCLESVLLRVSPTNWHLRQLDIWPRFQAANHTQLSPGLRSSKAEAKRAKSAAIRLVLKYQRAARKRVEERVIVWCTEYDARPKGTPFFLRICCEFVLWNMGEWQSCHFYCLIICSNYFIKLKRFLFLFVQFLKTRFSIKKCPTNCFFLHYLL